MNKRCAHGEGELFAMNEEVRKAMYVTEQETIKDALKKLSKTGYKTLFVVDGNFVLLGTISDGDIRRYLLKGNSLDVAIREIYCKNPICIREDNLTMNTAKDLMITRKIEFIPVLDGNGRVADFITMRQLVSGNEIAKLPKANIKVPVIIMAGGKGARLEPFSNIFPKALIPIGNKPVIEVIIDEFKKHGARQFYLAVHHKAEMIESYFNHKKKDYDIAYIRENDFLGTVGSLRLIEKELVDTFIVSNCDVIVRANFEEVMQSHKEKKAALTILSSIQHYKIPYGVIKFTDGGKVTEMVEKPEYTFTVNTGVYIMRKEALRFIPKGKHFDITDLIKALLKARKCIITYPVNENDYIDIGQWEEYKAAIEKLQILR